jgi:hypothetical protein
MLLRFLNSNFGFFAPRMFFEGDAGDGSGGGDGDANSPFQFSGKFVEKTDPRTKNKIKVPVEIDAYFGHVIGGVREEIEGKYKPMIKTLEDQNSDLSSVRDEYEKLKALSMSTEERARADAKKVIDEHDRIAKAAKDEAGFFKGLFEKTKVENDVLASFGDIALFNPDQVKQLFIAEGKAHPEQVVGADGKPVPDEWETRVALMVPNDKGEDELVEGTPKQLFSRWINAKRNLHHKVIAGNPGAGSRTQQTFGKNAKVDLSELDPKSRIDEARRQGIIKQNK